MNIVKKMLAMLLVAAFVLVPLSSCGAQLKLPKEEAVSEVQKKTYGEKLRESIEVDPLFPDDPADDEELNILFVGNSYSTHWPDELAEFLGAAGYENALVCNIYHSGASFEDHWTWYENNESVEDFHINRPGQGGKQIWSNVGLEECLTYANWDVISFQQTNELVGSTGSYRVSISQWLPKLYSHIYAYFPDATYYWQQNWSHSAGKDGYKSKGTVEKNTIWHRTESERVCNDWGFINAPLGDAWPSVRYDSLFYDFPGEDFNNANPNKSLHTRIYEGDNSKTGQITNSDLSHDGNIGGGQYLNAAVWFEMITHKSVVGNSFVPSYYHEESDTTYTFTAEQIAKLQNAAHQAVFEDYGEEWYK